MFVRNLLLIPNTTSSPSYPAHEWVSRSANLCAILFLQKRAVQQCNYSEAARLNEQLRQITH